MENRERIKKKVCETFIEMAKEMPVEQIQVKTLVQRAGVSRSGFYVYYDSVWDVLQEIENELFSTTYSIKRDYLNGMASRDPMDISHDVLRHLVSSGDLIEALTSHGGDQAYLAAWTGQIRSQIEMWRGKPLKEDSVEAQLYAEFAIGGIQRMIHAWSLRKEEISTERIIALFDTVHQGIQQVYQKID